MEEPILLEPSLRNVIDQKSLKWIFVGGKGGVGKTTCSSSLAFQLAKVRETVLLLSTNPAHNLSDALELSLTSSPRKVGDFDNLFAMEVDPSGGYCPVNLLPGYDHKPPDKEMGIAKDLMSSVPGLAEVMKYAEVMRMIQERKFSVVVLDTASTGHTLWLLGLPRLLEQGAAKLLDWCTSFQPLIAQMSSFVGISGDLLRDTVRERLHDTIESMKALNNEFRNPELSTFVCVCSAEYLSLFETERLVQALAKFQMDSRNLIVNQIVPDSKKTIACELCSTRIVQQGKYLDQISDLYCDFHVTKIPMQIREVRGIEQLKIFSDYLAKQQESTSLCLA